FAGKFSSERSIERGDSSAINGQSPIPSIHDSIIIGGGIVGLATAMAVGKNYPKARTLLPEKWQDVAQHQTGRNSGVSHFDIYYKPGSLKATFAREGNRSMVEFLPLAWALA